MASKPTYKIPFLNGNQCDFGYGDKLADNFEFEDTLKFKCYGRGRSSVTFEFERESTGKTVSFFVSTMSEIIPLLKDGKITGRFTFIKKGQNFGCKMISQ